MKKDLQIDKKMFNSLNIAFLFVTANENELKAFNKCFFPTKEDVYYLYPGKKTYRIGIFGKYQVAHIHLEQQGLIKEKASITAISDVLTEYDFNAVIMVGICFGFDETKQKMTDVVISKYIQPYESVKISNGVFQNRNVCYAPESQFVNKFLNYSMPSNNNISYHPGTLLCGEKLLDDVSEKKKIISLFPNTKDFVGGDMESAGIASAMENRNKHNYIIIKGISDWGYKKNDKLGEDEKNIVQFDAAYNAVRFAYEVLSSADFSSLGIKDYQKHAKEIFDIQVNPYRLFYHRNDTLSTLSTLSKKGHINEQALRHLETEPEQGEEFHRTSARIINYLNINLKCTSEGIESIQTPEDVKFFYGNKGKKSFCPVQNAKAVVFDFDGTLTINDSSRTSWELIWDRLGYEKNECASYHRKYSNGDINHEEWCNITLVKFKEKDLTKAIVEEVAQNNIRLIEGVEEVFRILKENNIKVYICSGSVNTIIEKVLGSAFQYVDEIKCNSLLFDQENIICQIIGTKYDFKGKRDYIRQVANENDIDVGDVVFLGNSNNDEWAYESGCKTVIVNPKWTNPNKRKIWNYYIQEEVRDLKQVLPYILPTKYNL